MRDKLISKEELQERIKELKDKNKVIVSTSGCFDILHAGHVEYLQEAKRYGDYLIIMLNSDLSVKLLKGPSRPIVSENERAIVLAALEVVDYICIFDEQTPCSLIEKIQPNIVVKGGDYKGKLIPEMNTVSKYGGEVRYLQFLNGCSTTNIIEKIEKNIGRE